MNKKLISIATLFAAVSIFSGYVLVNGKKNPVSRLPDTRQVASLSDGVTLFYGDGCPHCALVEEFVSRNGVEASVPFVKKEVYYNKQNAGELTERAKTCGMATGSIGVPFLWDGAKCIVGDEPIINFFKLKSGQQ